MPTLVPEEQRRFAAAVVRRLREAGFEAYWAGGCVRDELLGLMPKDYDVATDATPPQIRSLFGKGRTLAIGAAFGVITVLGSKMAGMVEVTTFRRDAEYSDGRHPDHVTFSSAEEDASRRDFTVNGLFYDPIDRRVLDFVGGREDLRRRVLRAIGDPRKRFAEDKLRMLRAVRFIAAFDFHLEAETLAAIREMAAEITVVSPERIATEMRRLLTAPRRAKAVRLMLEVGLATPLLPEIVPPDEIRHQRLDHALAVLDRLSRPAFPLALGALLHELVDPPGARRVGRRWRLSNRETDRVAWLVKHRAALSGSPLMRWSALQPLLIAEGIEDLLALHEAASPTGRDDVDHCRSLLERPPEQLDPPRLLTGDDLRAHGVPSGPRYRTLLQRIRNAQLDEEIHTRAEALELVDRLLQQ
ncbi:MAG: CCA tRNA nucleotidyltransferase [Pirellulales bacterium]|nr:CCA tRNA nucleotidyltransferase [Pirellulales bacterium]